MEKKINFICNREQCKNENLTVLCNYLYFFLTQKDFLKTTDNKTQNVKCMYLYTRGQ